MNVALVITMVIMMETIRGYRSDFHFIEMEIRPVTPYSLHHNHFCNECSEMDMNDIAAINVFAKIVFLLTFPFPTFFNFSL